MRDRKARHAVLASAKVAAAFGRAGSNAFLTGRHDRVGYLLGFPYRRKGSILG
jgi:hypothetical protein